MRSPLRLLPRLSARLAPRLALRVYLVGLVQTGVIAAGFVTLMEASRPRGLGPVQDHARYVAATIASSSSTHVELACMVSAVVADRSPAARSSGQMRHAPS